MFAVVIAFCSKDRCASLRHHVQMLHTWSHVTCCTKIRKTHIATVRTPVLMWPVVPWVRWIGSWNSNQEASCYTSFTRKYHWLNHITCNTSFYNTLEVSLRHITLHVSTSMAIIRCLKSLWMETPVFLFSQYQFPCMWSHLWATVSVTHINILSRVRTLRGGLGGRPRAARHDKWIPASPLRLPRMRQPRGEPMPVRFLTCSKVRRCELLALTGLPHVLFKMGNEKCDAMTALHGLVQ
jgi:hypothetical protein